MEDKYKLKELPEILEDTAYGLTFKEKRDLKEQGIVLKSLDTDEAEEDAIVALMKLRDIKERDVLSLDYSILLAWLVTIITATYNPSQSESKKK